MIFSTDYFICYKMFLSNNRINLSLPTGFKRAKDELYLYKSNV